MIELAVLEGNHAREWLVSLDRCISRDSDLDVNALMPDDWTDVNQYDSRIPHLPVLVQNIPRPVTCKPLPIRPRGFWVSAKIWDDSQSQLAVSCGKTHWQYDADSAHSNWCRKCIDEETDTWDDELMHNEYHGGEILGAEHWA